MLFRSPFWSIVYNNHFSITNTVSKNKFLQQVVEPYLDLVGAFSPFTFSVITERYGFRVIVMSVGFMLVVMSLVLCGPCNISLTESTLGSLVGLV